MKEQLVKAFAERYGSEPSLVSRAPGRLEILGNHTDYNSGNVLSVAVDRFMHIAASPVEGTVCKVWDDALKQERVFDLEKLDERQKGDWANYIKGVIVAFNERGARVPAFNAVIHGTVPLSAGMSSSAAFEMAAAVIFKKFTGAGFDNVELAKIGQACENKYIGANTGLLDQFSSMYGKENALVYSDFRYNTAEAIPMPAGVSFVVVNSMVKHVLTSEYNICRQNCEDALRSIALRHPEAKALRDVTSDMLLENRGRMFPNSFDAAAHVVGEQFRVAMGMRLLKSGDFVSFGMLMFQSHESSKYLFKNSCPELDAIIDIAHSRKECYGARLSGGGFGGITVHLVPTECAENYATSVADEYHKKTGVKPTTFICKAANGATLI